MRMIHFTLPGVNLANGRERGAGEERVTKIDGWSDIEYQGERCSMQKHTGKCKARQKVKNQAPEKVSWRLQMYQNKVLLLGIKYSFMIMGENKNTQKWNLRYDGINQR